MAVKSDRLILLSLVMLLSAVPSLAQQEDVFRKFAGTYVTGHEFGGGSLTLDSKGDFSDGSGSDDGTRVSSSGNYTLSEGLLRFVMVKETWKRGEGGKELNLLDPNDRKEAFGKLDSGETKKEFKMLPLEWSGRIYLLYEEDLKNFANAVNLGIEPRASLTSRYYISPWFGSFYLRSGDEQKKATGKPPLPEPWLSFLLSKPISANVLSIDEIVRAKWNMTFTATIDKGSRDGLKVGMKLLTSDEEPSPWGGTEVISVDEKTAKIRSQLARSELKVGDKISSKYQPKDIYR